ncbi:MAG: type II restriction endonuclease, partial [Gemmatimonadetes bacterium]|nr:type II restriction endonuclease [Gemmatimonadota bacterium]
MSDEPDPLRATIASWRADPGATYCSWFLWDQRVKNFRSIRRGIQEVARRIEADEFGNAFRGSALETVVKSVAEQRQMFRGADHAWIWKPKLRIPDIYESRENQLAFGRFLDACLCCRTEESLLDAIRRLDALGIRGLGPTAANLMYFLHPTLVPPFNTAMVDGFNAVSGARIRLGKWTHYLAMRAGMLELNARYRDLLSNDLGAIAGLLFDLGTGRHSTSSTVSGEAARAAGTSELGRVRRKAAREAEALEAGVEGDRTHTEIHGWLRDLGRALGFDVWIAANGR